MLCTVLFVTVENDGAGRDRAGDRPSPGAEPAAAAGGGAAPSGAAGRHGGRERRRHRRSRAPGRAPSQPAPAARAVPTAAAAGSTHRPLPAAARAGARRALAGARARGAPRPRPAPPRRLHRARQQPARRRSYRDGRLTIRQGEAVRGRASSVAWPAASALPAPLPCVTRAAPPRRPTSPPAKRTRRHSPMSEITIDQTEL